MGYNLRLVTSPAVEPLTLDQAKTQVRVEKDATEHDDDLASLITEARQYVEQALGRQLVTATWDFAIDAFPSCESELLLPLPPLQSVNSVSYYDTDGNLQTWAASNYHVSTDGSECGRLVLAPGASWPAAQCRADAVVIRFVAGYGATGAAVPAPLKRAIKLLVGHWFLHREETIAGTIIGSIPTGVERILALFRPGDEFTCFDPGS